MRAILLGVCSLVFMTFAFFGAGCVVGIHDARWHYDHDYDDHYRATHPWHEDRHDWDR